LVHHSLIKSKTAASQSVESNANKIKPEKKAEQETSETKAVKKNGLFSFMLVRCSLIYNSSCR